MPLAILVGVALRLAWALLLPAPFTSDGWSYYRLAENLAEGEPYRTLNDGWAEWPPGYPFLLFLLFQVFGVGPWAVTAANLLLFAAAVPVVHALGRRMGDEGTARLGVLLLALWPNLVASAGVACKEMVITVLLPLALLLYLVAEGRARGWAWRLGAGLVLGAATLTQPALMLLAGIFPVYELLRRAPPLRAAGRLALLLLGMAAVISPWSLRNYRIFGEVVPVSTNGGSVFYRANNPLASGGWIEHGERRLDGYDELTGSKLGFAWGKEWIRENPEDFLRLALTKQVLFLGDDATGVYDTLKRGRGLSGALYAGLKLASNAWWWGLWALILVTLFLHRDLARRPEALLFMLTVLYFWAIDSVFESGARHHVPLVGLLAILAACASVTEAVRGRVTSLVETPSLNPLPRGAGEGRRLGTVLPEP
jgi:4-amino-4-deoxy-L-arabinose transferase-like glycosyltransferase